MYARCTISKDGQPHAIAEFPNHEQFELFRPEALTSKGYDLAWEFKCRDCDAMIPAPDDDHDADYCDDCIRAMFGAVS